MDSNLIFGFLKGIAKNNNKEWFEANKAVYQQARAEFIDFIAEIIKGIQTFDKTIGELEPKRCVFRFYRDMRFSKDKTPYKRNFGASIKKDGRKSRFAGYYIHIEPNNSYIGGGNWRPERDDLAKIREEIDYNPQAFKAILNDKSFKSIYGGLDEEDKLSRPPKDYAADNPNIEMLKNRSFIATQMIPNDILNHPEKAIESFKILYPFLQFINRNLE